HNTPPSDFTTSPEIVRASYTSTVTLTARDGNGNQATTGGLTVVFSLGAGAATGTFSAVTDNGDGTYTATFTGILAGANTITGTNIGSASSRETPPLPATTVVAR